MKKKTGTGSIAMPKSKRQWKIYQQLGAMAQNLDRLPDIGEIRQRRPYSAPQELLPMVF